LPPPGAGRATSEPVRRKLLEHLVEIDLEYRWCQAAQGAVAQARPTGHRPEGCIAPPLPGSFEGRPRLEAYVQCYPALGLLEQLSAELITAEYRVRKRWGDRPDHEEYANRFAPREREVRDALARVDGQLVAEFAPRATSEGRGMGGPNAAPRPPDRHGVPTVAPPQLDAGGVARLPQPPASLPSFTDALHQYGLLSPAQLQEVVCPTGLSSEPRALAKELLQRGWLTAFQVNQLLQGRGADLQMGPYVLLQRLGEGGAGQVFKARHQKMNRLVALKIIRKELLADAEVVGRFCREIKVLSQLDHPNVVHAYDAGPVGASYFLAMEYVEGTDLARLVKQCGPLPVMQACAYVRQAALGLQHAHQRGLVHRDIKPHNLIMSLREGRIKVADLGLARLPRAANEEATAALAGSKTSDGLTPPGAVAMGTLDYLAPEQALNFHAADIRADIYSLGCTLWYLLIGQPPFPNGTLAEKLLSHQSKEVPAIDKLRPDVPAGLASVLRRMLAKRPEDRYRTPAEVAEAVTPYISTPDARDLEFDPGGWSVRAGAYTTWQMLCKFAKRNKAFTAAVVTAMVLLACSSVIIYQAWRETGRAYQQYRHEQTEKDRRTREAVPALVEAARMSGERQELEEGLRRVDMALAYDPNDVSARLVKGQLRIAQMRFEEARVELERCLQGAPKNVEALTLLKLTSDARKEDGKRLLDLADALLEQKASGPSACLIQEIAKLTTSRRQLVPHLQKRISTAWPGLGNRLSLVEKDGSLQLDFSGCRQQVRNLGSLRGIPLNSLDLSGCDQAQDLTPLFGMPLTQLNLGDCVGVQDLKPLKGMPLTTLNLAHCVKVEDLSPLKGMPLTTLKLEHCVKVEDLSPLKGMRLTELNLVHCRGVRDLKALQDMPLTSLNCKGSGVLDLSPLRRMPLTAIVLYETAVHDLSPLEDMRLSVVGLPPMVTQGMAGLRRMKTLKTINEMRSEDFWKTYVTPQ
jgi:serine/threonine protein kinase